MKNSTDSLGRDQWTPAEVAASQTMWVVSQSLTVQIRRTGVEKLSFESLGEEVARWSFRNGPIHPIKRRTVSINSSIL
jgi:hypothetical protein